jgi:hypothetical protein
VVIGGRKKHASQVAVCPPSYVPRHQAQGILKTQVFKKQCKKYFAKRKIVFKKNQISFEKKISAKKIRKRKIAFKKIKYRLKRTMQKKICAKKKIKHRLKEKSLLKKNQTSFEKKNRF